MKFRRKLVVPVAVIDGLAPAHGPIRSIQANVGSHNVLLRECIMCTSITVQTMALIEQYCR